MKTNLAFVRAFRILVFVLCMWPAYGFCWRVSHLEIQRFSPTLGTEGSFLTASTQIAPHLQPLGALYFNHALRPFMAYLGDGTRVPLVGNHTAADLALAMGFWDRFHLALGMPITLNMTGQSYDSLPAGSGGGLGDLRLGGAVRFADHLADFGLSLAATATLALPTGGATYLGDGVPGVAFSAVGMWEYQAFRIMSNSGIRFRHMSGIAGLPAGDELTYGLGFAYRIVPPAEAMLELVGATGLGIGFLQRETSPLELIASGRWRPFPHMALMAGAGTGLVRGFGTPALRVLFGMSFYPEGAQLRSIIPYQREARPELVRRRMDIQDVFPGGVEPGPLVAIDENLGPPGFRHRFGFGRRGEIPSDSIKLELRLPSPGLDELLEAKEQSDKASETEVMLYCFAEDGNCMRDDLVRVIYSAKYGIVMSHAIEFKAGSASFDEGATEMLDLIANMMMDWPALTLVVVAHNTDTMVAETDFVLSERMSRQVVGYLVDSGVQSNRLIPRWMGGEFPLVPPKDAEARATNRRIVFEVLYQPPE